MITSTDKNIHAVSLGKLGGQSKSEAKVKAARENAKKATEARKKKLPAPTEVPNKKS